MHNEQLPVGTAATATDSKSVEEIPQGFESLTGSPFQYSDNGIKKRAKSLGCDLKLIRSAGKVFMDTHESSKLE